MAFSIFTGTISQIFSVLFSSKYTSLKFLVLQYIFHHFDIHWIRISSVLHIISSDLILTFSSSISLRICHLLAFSWLDTSSGSCLSANVPGLHEYLAIYTKSKSISFIALIVFSNWSSVSQGNPTMRSVEIEKRGSLDLRYPTWALKSEYVCFLFIFLRIASSQLCSAKCIWLHVFLRSKCASNISFVMSWGFDEVNLSLSIQSIFSISSISSRKGVLLSLFSHLSCSGFHSFALVSFP